MVNDNTVSNVTLHSIIPLQGFKTFITTLPGYFLHFLFNILLLYRYYETLIIF